MTHKIEIRYCTFPRTDPPTEIAKQTVDAFKKHLYQISTVKHKKGLKSDQVLAKVASELLELGFNVETGKKQSEKIHRPVFFGENG